MSDLGMAEEPSVSPYRAEPPLEAMIPPDRRRAKAIALLVVGLLAGGFLTHIGDDAIALVKELRPKTVVAAPITVASTVGRVGKLRLLGPNGAEVSFPPARPTVVNVWLQGCADCMPAFDAYRDLQGGMGVFPVVNVAYGQADLEWARRYRVDQNLVIDPDGAAIVKPLGVGSFTTMVVDTTGSVVLTDRPDRVGYAGRVLNALEQLGVRTVPPPDPAADARGLSAVQIETTVRAHPELGRACLRPRRPAARINVTVTVVVAPNGSVASAHAKGDDATVAACVERAVERWTFPRSDHETRVDLPFQLDPSDGDRSPHDPGY